MALFQKRLEGVAPIEPDHPDDAKTIDGYCRTVETCVEVLRPHLVGWPKEIVRLCATYLKRYISVRPLEFREIKNKDTMWDIAVDRARCRLLVNTSCDQPDCTVQSFTDDVQDAKQRIVGKTSSAMTWRDFIRIDPFDQSLLVTTGSRTILWRVDPITGAPHAMGSPSSVIRRSHKCGVMLDICFSHSGRRLFIVMGKWILVGTRKPTATPPFDFSAYQWSRIKLPQHKMDEWRILSSPRQENVLFMITPAWHPSPGVWSLDLSNPMDPKLSRVTNFHLPSQQIVISDATGRMYYLDNTGAVRSIDPATGRIETLTDSYHALAGVPRIGLTMDQSTGDLYVSYVSYDYQIFVVTGLENR